MPSEPLWRRVAGAAALSVAVTAGVTGGGPQAQVIDRILAVVGSQPVTLSDVRAAMMFGLVAPAPPSGDPIAAALEALIDRELILEEVRRYQPLEPAVPQVRARLEETRRRFPDLAAFARALALAGMTEPRLEGMVRDTLRAERYLAERFGSGAPPTDEELARYYRDREGDFQAGGVLPPFETVRDRVRERLLAERRQRLMAGWLDGLRRRTEVQVLYRILPDRP